MFDILRKPLLLLPVALIASIPISLALKAKAWKEWEDNRDRDFSIWSAYWREKYPNNDDTEDDLYEMFVRLRGLPGSKGYRQFKQTIINRKNRNNEKAQ